MGRAKWQEEVAALSRILSGMVFTRRDSSGLQIGAGFDLWRDWTLETRKEGRAVYLVGNGASASIASHMAADLAKNAGMHTQVFTDPSLLTAMGNDIGYESVYSEPLRMRGVKGDMLVAISSSGRSQNILNAVDTAESLGMRRVTLSAMSENNPLRGAGDLNIHVSAGAYGHAETCHAAILHFWMDMIGNSSVDDVNR